MTRAQEQEQKPTQEQRQARVQSNEEKVISFLSKELELPIEKLKRNSRLRQDLGLDGADAADIIEIFSLTFNIDIDNFRINDYFGPQAGINPVLSFILSIFGNSKPLKTLRISNLVNAMNTQKLG